MTKGDPVRYTCNWTSCNHWMPLQTVGTICLHFQVIDHYWRCIICHSLICVLKAMLMTLSLLCQNRTWFRNKIIKDIIKYDEVIVEKSCFCINMTSAFSWRQLFKDTERMKRTLEDTTVNGGKLWHIQTLGTIRSKRTRKAQPKETSEQTCLFQMRRP